MCVLICVGRDEWLLCEAYGKQQDKEVVGMYEASAMHLQKCKMHKKFPQEWCYVIFSVKCGYFVPRSSLPFFLCAVTIFLSLLYV
jgi:hypothetical protein